MIVGEVGTLEDIRDAVTDDDWFLGFRKCGLSLVCKVNLLAAFCFS